MDVVAPASRDRLSSNPELTEQRECGQPSGRVDGNGTPFTVHGERRAYRVDRSRRPWRRDVRGGGVLIGVALIPKALAFITAIPALVLVAYALVMLCLMFMKGIKILAQDGIDVRKSHGSRRVVLSRHGIPARSNIPGSAERDLADFARKRHDDRLNNRDTADAVVGNAAVAPSPPSGCDGSTTALCRRLMNIFARSRREWAGTERQPIGSVQPERRPF